MDVAHTEKPAPGKPLRLWPGVAAVALMLLVRFAVPLVKPDAAGFGILGGVAGGLVVLIWWLLFSRARWVDRLGAVAVMAAGLATASRLIHESIANGMMGKMLYIFAAPVLSLTLAASAAATRRLSDGSRRAWMAASILLACGLLTLIRTGGLDGDAVSDLHWRWTKTPEERLLAEAVNEPAAPPAPGPVAAVTPAPRVPEPPAKAPAARPATRETAEADPVWPGFRGPNRDGVVGGAQIGTDWSRTPPVEMWRRAVGPGWSSFAVRGGIFYTQEQRGEDEVVSAYKVATGEPVWRHRDAARFWESNAGAGPRGTPTLSGDRVYTFGATGILNALDARTGAVIWSRNAASDTKTKTPGWGFASSPLVSRDMVIIAAAGTLAAYHADTGEPRWFGPAGGWGYSSPHLAVIGGVPQVLLLNGEGVISVAPSDGALLWKHAWEGDSIVQPGVTADGGVLLGSGSGMGGGTGMRRLTLAQGPGGWTATERWTSNGLKPYFNDFVVHKGHAFGFDGGILACIDLEDGKRKWKGGRFGHGQLVLIPGQDTLLVLSEEGELGLVRAGPERFTELARVKAIEGKTWNHPALAGDVLLARNSEEMAAFRLSRAGR